MNDTKTHYRIFATPNIVDLMREVNHFLDEGWLLQGGVSVTGNEMGTMIVYAQAMIKIEPLE